MLYRRFGKDIVCKVREDAEGQLQVSDSEGTLSYRSYIGKRLGQLHIFAQKLLADRPPDPFYVDGKGKLEALTPSESQGACLDLLEAQCHELSPFSSRVVFITADAGHGKTALLRQYQHAKATKHARGQCSDLFWHVDLQGRQLVRLSEALMGDLGELRMSGLYMPSILVLIRLRLLVLAVDGFDELAAEQGTTDALGALRVLLDQMNGRGVIVAAARRTFFSTDNYMRRTKMVVTGETIRSCEFNEIRLLPWQSDSRLSYLRKVEVDGQKFSSPQTTNIEIQSQFSSHSNHPILTTPFLFSHVAKGVLRYGTSVSEFVGGMVDPIQGVPAVVQAFIKREVSDKWKSKDTGQPYLTVDQHILLLSAIADEMWNNQTDRLLTDVVEAVTAILLDDWKIEPDRRRQIHEMVRMHVLLHRPLDSREDVRGFEHPEFQHYFVAQTLSSRLKQLVSGSKKIEPELARFLSLGQLPDAVPKYASMLDFDAAAKRKIIETMCDLANKEWRPTYLQSNVGTLIPFFLRGADTAIKLSVTGKIMFSSVVLSNTTLENTEFVGTSFLQTPFTRVNWRNITFKDCKFYEVSFERDSTYENVTFSDCLFEGVALIVDNVEVDRAYSVDRIRQLMAQCGITETDVTTAATRPRSDASKLAGRVLRFFTRTTILTEGTVKMKFSNKSHEVESKVIPAMERYGILERVEWKGSGNQRAWQLTRAVDEILHDDNGGNSTPGERFWLELNV